MKEITDHRLQLTPGKPCAALVCGNWYVLESHEYHLMRGVEDSNDILLRSSVLINIPWAVLNIHGGRIFEFDSVFELICHVKVKLRFEHKSWNFFQVLPGDHSNYIGGAPNVLFWNYHYVKEQVVIAILNAEVYLLARSSSWFFVSILDNRKYLPTQKDTPGPKELIEDALLMGAQVLVYEDYAALFADIKI